MTKGEPDDPSVTDHAKSLLSAIKGPGDVKRLDVDQLPLLAAELRDRLIGVVTHTGGHLGPNLGAVELTIALHRVFYSPYDKILFDTGHQAYVHKLLTGRDGGFETLRQTGGLSGYPSRAESEHDVIENSHASTALSYADGLAKAFALRREARQVVAVVGDGALTGGMCWEALNNIAAAKDRPVIIVVNDNGRSYSPTIGGLADYLAALRLRPGYERALSAMKTVLNRTPVVGPPLYDALHGAKTGLKDFVAPQGMFEDLGLKYVGPIDGHDEQAVENALRRARDFGGPVIVHCVTRKGFGYEEAENDEADCLHQVRFPSTEHKPTAVFSEEMLKIGAARPDVVAITAAMLHPTGLAPFAQEFPDRIYDVGIAEQHAVTSAAGLATGGLHPVVAIYATFLNRAFDQVLLDVALHRLPVTFALTHGGVTGDDGPSHNGMWDLSVFGVVPGLRVAAPRDETTMRAQLWESLDIEGPSLVRFPKASLTEDVPAIGREGAIDVLRADPDADTLIVSVGAMAPVVLEAAERIADQGIATTVVDPRWVLPVPDEIVRLARQHRLVVTVEDNGRTGGIGTQVALALHAAELDIPSREIGIPKEFLVHGKPADVRARIGLTPQDIARRVVEWSAHLGGPRDPVAGPSATDLQDTPD